MADGTKIEWADATVNAVNGCSVVSPGCTHCYAMRLAGTRMKTHPSRAGLTQESKAGPVWTGEVRLNEEALLQPLRWKRPRRIFWNAHGDLFHEAVPHVWIDRVFAVAALTPQHTHMILTKRSARMREWFAGNRIGVVDEAAELVANAKGDIAGEVCRENMTEGCPWPLPNVWLGVSVEDQARADERIPDLLATPAAVRFISAEPLLGPVDLRRYLLGFEGFTLGGNPGECACGHGHGFSRCSNSGGVTRACHHGGCDCPGFRRRAGVGLHWVIAGGESGPGARPMHPAWARALRDQCQAAGVAFHFKQWGEWLPVECGQRGSAIVSFEPGIPMGRGFHRLRRWDGAAFRGAGDGESVGSFMTPGTTLAVPVGKKRAGRLLDGRTHDGFPA